MVCLNNQLQHQSQHTFCVLRAPQHPDKVCHSAAGEKLEPKQSKELPGYLGSVLGLPVGVWSLSVSVFPDPYRVPI